MQEATNAEGRQVFNLSRSSRIPIAFIPQVERAVIEAAWLGLRTW